MAGAAPIKVLIVDDHPMVRQGLRTFFSTCDDIEVVAEAGNGIEAVEKCLQAPPDVVLMDMVMPGMDGATATAKVLESCPDARVIVLTSFVDPATVTRVLEAGRPQLPAQGRQPRQVGRRHTPGPPGEGHHRFQRRAGTDGGADGGPATHRRR